MEPKKRGKMPTKKMLWFAVAVLQLKKPIPYNVLKEKIEEAAKNRIKQHARAKMELEVMRGEIEVFPIKKCPPFQLSKNIIIKKQEW